MLKFDGLVACICEGSAEHAVMDILLENDKLIFTELLEDKIILNRSARDFENKYLGKNFKEKLTIVRVLDSRNENFKLSKLYKNKVDVVNVITAPEIEMLIILNENKFDDFKKFQSKEKMTPSEFCKNKLKYKNAKKYEFVKDYFSDVDVLVDAIKQYKKKSKIKGSETILFDLLK